MTIAEAAKSAKTEGAKLIRYRTDSFKQTGTAQYDVKPIFTGNKKGWTMLDSFTASVISAVYDALKPDNQAKFNNLPLGKLLDFCWKQVK